MSALSPAPQCPDLNRLAERIRSIECGPPSDRADAVATGWGQPNDPLTMDRGVVHEWFSRERPDSERSDPFWAPPLLLLVHLARRAIAGAGLVLWIGRHVWPSYHALTSSSDGPNRWGLLDRSIFVDAPDPASRIWAIDVALRSRAAEAVIADSHNLDLAQSRRLQIAAQSSRALTLLARPGSDLAMLSCAATRWMVSPRPSPHGQAQWEVTCLRRKGVRRLPAPDAPPHFILEWNRATGSLDMAPRLVDRSADAAAPHIAIREAG